MSVRRIVTGHDPAGRSVIVDDASLLATGIAEDDDRADTRFFAVWATHEMPVVLGDEAMARQREGSATTIVGSGQGSAVRIGELAPGARSPMHRTGSLDYGILLEGACDMELDGGETVTVHAGDVVVQRGTNHVWHNRSEEPCRFAWILLDGAMPA
jgi:quercetin dioxygenase-like cupin family protein